MEVLPRDPTVGGVRREELNAPCAYRHPVVHSPSLRHLAYEHAQRRGKAGWESAEQVGNPDLVEGRGQAVLPRRARREEDPTGLP